MHEVAIARSIQRIVERARCGRAVESVAVDIGALRQVVPETLTACWDLVVAGTELAGARLETAAIPAVVWCRTCDHRRQLVDLPSMMCEACGGTATVTESGEELLVRSISLREG